MKLDSDIFFPSQTHHKLCCTMNSVIQFSESSLFSLFYPFCIIIISFFSCFLNFKMAFVFQQNLFSTKSYTFRQSFTLSCIYLFKSIHFLHFIFDALQFTFFFFFSFYRYQVLLNTYIQHSYLSSQLLSLLICLLFVNFYILSFLMFHYLIFLLVKRVNLL